MLVVVLLVLPMMQNVYYSFFEWDGISAPIFNGLKNYLAMFTDRVIAGSMLNTVLWVVFTLVFPALGGLVVAVFVTGLRGENFFKSIFFIPLTISLRRHGHHLDLHAGQGAGGAQRACSTLLGIPLKPSYLTERSAEHVLHDLRLDVAAAGHQHGDVPHGPGHHSP